MNDEKNKTSLGSGIAWAGFWIACAIAYASDQIAQVLQ